MKVFSITLSTFTSDGFPSRVRQCRAFVACKTKKRAAELFGVSMNEFTNYGGETGNRQEIDLALSEPEQVFATSVDDYVNFEWRRISRTPHVPRPRSKVSWATALVHHACRPTFTTEQLEAIVSRFEMSNDPVGQSVAETARRLLSYDA